MTGKAEDIKDFKRVPLTPETPRVFGFECLKCKEIVGKWEVKNHVCFDEDNTEDGWCYCGKGAVESGTDICQECFDREAEELEKEKFVDAVFEGTEEIK